MHVAVGIILNSQREVLIAKRPLNKYKGGLWEFPGGKVEAGETGLQALQRELQEEIGIQIILPQAWLKIEYPDERYLLVLDTWLVTQFIGVPEGREGQQITWIRPSALNPFDFPEANHAIILKLQEMDGPALT